LGRLRVRIQVADRLTHQRGHDVDRLEFRCRRPLAIAPSLLHRGEPGDVVVLDEGERWHVERAGDAVEVVAADGVGSGADRLRVVDAPRVRGARAGLLDPVHPKVTLADARGRVAVLQHSIYLANSEAFRTDGCLAVSLWCRRASVRPCESGNFTRVS